MNQCASIESLREFQSHSLEFVDGNDASVLFLFREVAVGWVRGVVSAPFRVHYVLHRPSPLTSSIPNDLFDQENVHHRLIACRTFPHLGIHLEFLVEGIVVDEWIVFVQVGKFAVVIVRSAGDKVLNVIRDSGPMKENVVGVPCIVQRLDSLVEDGRGDKTGCRE